MTPLQSLLRRGFVVIPSTGDRIRLYPDPGNLAPKIQRHKSSIVAELREHQARMIVQAEEFEQRILKALDSGRISQADAEEKLNYIFRLTATTPSLQLPCACGEILLWCFPEETAAVAAPEKKFPLLCYKCHPPKDGWVQFLLAMESSQ